VTPMRLLRVSRLGWIRCRSVRRLRVSSLPAHIAREPQLGAMPCIGFFHLSQSQARSLSLVTTCTRFSYLLILALHDSQPQPPLNKSPEPSAVGACRSAVAVHAANRRRLVFYARYRSHAT
jgi:hypothetical protein